MASQFDAGLINRRHSAGCGVASRLDHRARAPLRNHSRDNVMAMREKMRQARGKSIIESLKQPQPEFKLKQFGNVKSRLFDLPRPAPNDRLERGRRSPSAPAPSPEPTQYEENILPASQRNGEDGAADEGDGGEMDLASFEAEVERLKALHGNKKPAAAAPQQYKKDSAGRPAYLQKIKSDLADQQREAEERRRGPLVPPGYRQMPEGERQDTLDSLNKKREELEKAVQRLPFNIETAAQKNREKTLMDKIQETDSAIKTFSNPMVLVGA